MNIGILQGIGTVLAMVAFIGVCVWAWSSKNKQRFDEAAQLPFMDDDLGADDLDAEDSAKESLDNESPLTSKSKDSQKDQGRQDHE
jgi:cytochrome c oxidase cbb3-type subunit 4|tara:strand:- start:212 stop:469 length:258 start_codon:yes stop_codon:yes gene_type:complete